LILINLNGIEKTYGIKNTRDTFEDSRIFLKLIFPCSKMTVVGKQKNKGSQKFGM